MKTLFEVVLHYLKKSKKEYYTLTQSGIQQQDLASGVNVERNYK